MGLMSRGNETIRAALLSGVRPAVDARDMHTADLSDLGVASALLDQDLGRRAHEAKLRSSQHCVKPQSAKIAADTNCVLRNVDVMASEPFSGEWLSLNFERTGTKSADLVRFLQSRGRNIDASKVSKMLADRRRASPEERPHIWEFFGYDPAQLWDALSRTHFQSVVTEEVVPYSRDSDKRATAGQLVDTAAQRTSPAPNAGLPEPNPTSAGLMPILGKSVGGTRKDRALFNGENLGYVARPGNLANKSRAYATYVHGDSMEPRYEAGEIVLVNPDKGYRKGNYVVAQVFDNDGDPPFGYIKRFISFADELVLEQLNPPENEDRIMRFPRENVVSVHRIVGTLDE